MRVPDGGHRVPRAGLSRDAVVARSERGWPSPIWKADGSAVLFVSQRDSSAIHDLWGADVREGTPVGTPRLLKASVGTDVQLVGHRRSGALYYVQPASQATRIFVTNAGGGPESAANLDAGLGFTGAFPSWSPDGTQLAWQTWGAAGTKLAVFSEKTGEVKSFPLPRGAWVGSPMWESDGSAVLVAMRDRATPRGIAVVKVDLPTAEVRAVGTYAPRENETWIPQFALAPNGDMLVMSTANQKQHQSLIAIDLPTGDRKVVLAQLETVRRANAIEENPVAFVTTIAWHPAPVFGVSVAADGRLAVISAADGATSLTLFTSDGKAPAVLYGPLRLRSWEQALVSPFGDPKWLGGTAGIAVGIQKDDFSWTLIRISNDGRVEPLGSPGHPLSLPADTLAFDIASDGKRVAYQRTVTFSGELAVLDLR